MFFGDITIEYMSHFSIGQKKPKKKKNNQQLAVNDRRLFELYRCLLDSRYMTVFIVLESLI